VTITLRPERPSDHRAVELLTREAFWGTEMPRCMEPLLVRRLRGAATFVPELDVVAEVDGEVVGNVMWSRASVVELAPDGEVAHDVLTFGPLSVLPAYQASGVGKALMRHTLAEAARLGHRAVVVYGHPDYYPRLGFLRGADLGITAPGGATFDALMAMALVPGGLDGVRGEFREDPVFHVDAAEAEAFDLAEYPPKEPATLTPLDVLDGHLPPGALEGLRAVGVPNVETLRRMSEREVTGVPGVGPAGVAALAAFLHSRGVRWGAA
jgi:predicted N-acetyltransferase YhbS